MNFAPSSALKIGVFTPYFQGDYIGEILNQIKGLCHLKGYGFHAVRTDSFGEFGVSLGIEHLDAVVIIRNAVHPKMVEKLLNRNIPVVAIAYDYFPLDVPVVTCDNSAGVDLAFDYLMQRNHKHLLFIGDLTHYDIRKRYERFSDRLNKFDNNHSYNPLICAPDALVSGGLASGRELLNREELATGILCGAGHTAVGLMSYLEEAAAEVVSNIDIVTFDNLPILDFFTPTLVRVDQNLNLLAEHAIATLEQMQHGSNFLNETIFVKPQLFTPDKGSQAAAAHPPLKSAKPFSVLNGNRNEIIRNIVASNLNDIMVLAPFYKDFMEYALLSKLVFDKHHRQQLQAIKVFKHGAKPQKIKQGPERHATIEKYPVQLPEILQKIEGRGVYHFPIYIDGDFWGALTFLGSTNPENKSEFSEFSSTFESITHLFSLQLQIRMLEDEEDPVPHSIRSVLPDTPAPTLDWDLQRGQVKWNDLALELLGFTTDLERNIYRTMEILDRIHDEDQSGLRRELTLSLTQHQPMTTVARVKNAEGHFQKFSFQGEITQFEDNQAIRYKCILSQIN